MLLLVCTGIGIIYRKRKEMLTSTSTTAQLRARKRTRRKIRMRMCKMRTSMLPHCSGMPMLAAFIYFAVAFI
jgi:hypothetical protein